MVELVAIEILSFRLRVVLAYVFILLKLLMKNRLEIFIPTFSDYDIKYYWFALVIKKSTMLHYFLKNNENCKYPKLKWKFSPLKVFFHIVHFCDTIDQ